MEMSTPLIPDTRKEELLRKGETVITYSVGRSMEPRLKSKQLHQLSPANWRDCTPGDIVFCKVNDSYFTHLVLEKSHTGLKIGNNFGYVNGFTTRVFGKVTKIFPL